MVAVQEHPAKGWAGTYGRVSVALVHLGQDSPENHDRVNRRAAVTYGLKIKPGYEFYDKGITGSKDVRRPGLERALKALVNREIEALIVPAMDRLSRRGMRHVGEMLDAVDAAGGRIILVHEALDSGVPRNRAIIAFLAEQARAEARNLSWRIETWHEGCRLKGKWNSLRPYGYLVQDGKLVQHPDEAPVVRRIMAEYLAGRSTRQIAVALNDEGIPAPKAVKATEIRAQGRESRARTDSTWSKTGVRSLLRNPVLVGWRQHNGKVVLGPDGEPVSFGEGILSPAEHVRLLKEMDRRTAIVYKGGNFDRIGGRTGGGRPARYLLTSVARCKSCNYAMRVQTATTRNAAAYTCASANEGYSCPARATIKLEDADAETMRQLTTKLGAMEPDDPVVDAIAERWRELTMPEGEDERAVLESRLQSVRSRIADLEEARYVRGEFTTADEIGRWETMMARLKAQRDAVIDAVNQLGPAVDFDLAALLDTYQSKERWEAIPLERRRELLRVAVAKVVIAPAHRRHLPADQRVRVILVREEEDD